MKIWKILAIVAVGVATAATSVILFVLVFGLPVLNWAVRR